MICYVDLPPHLQPCGKALHDLAKLAAVDLAEESSKDAFIAALEDASKILHGSKAKKEAPKKEQPKEAKAEATPEKKKKKDK